ncbi:Rrf2 family transcriptional regulator [Neorhizobium galegae]|nr:Rrf2 family transcriptional regulator [Neorhizobium galegae]
MRHDSRLSRMLHVLIHMDRHEGAATSETIAAMLNTNPVVVRRTMAGLREKGYVRSERAMAAAGDWVAPLSEMTLLDIYEAVGEPAVFAVGPACDQPACLVEQAVNAALSEAFGEAEKLLLSRFGKVTLADIARDFDARMARHPALADHAGTGWHS